MLAKSKKISIRKQQGNERKKTVDVYIDEKERAANCNLLLLYFPTSIHT